MQWLYKHNVSGHQAQLVTVEQRHEIQYNPIEESLQKLVPEIYVAMVNQSFRTVPFLL
jgi:hypothetical protein